MAPFPVFVCRPRASISHDDPPCPIIIFARSLSRPDAITPIIFAIRPPPALLSFTLERRTPPCCRERSPRPCRYLLRWDIMSSDFLESYSDSKRNKPEPSSQTLQDVVRWIEKRILTCPPDSFSAPQRLPSSPRSLEKSKSVQRLPTTLDDNKMLAEFLAMCLLVLAPDRGDYC